MHPFGNRKSLAEVVCHTVLLQDTEFSQQSRSERQILIGAKPIRGILVSIMTSTWHALDLKSDTHVNCYFQLSVQHSIVGGEMKGSRLEALQSQGQRPIHGQNRNLKDKRPGKLACSCYSRTRGSGQKRFSPDEGGNENSQKSDLDHFGPSG